MRRFPEGEGTRCRATRLPQCHTNGSSLKRQPQTPHLNLRHRRNTVYTQDPVSTEEMEGASETQRGSSLSKCPPALGNTGVGPLGRLSCTPHRHHQPIWAVWKWAGNQEAVLLSWWHRTAQAQSCPSPSQQLSVLWKGQTWLA